MDITLAYGRTDANLRVPDENLVAVVEPTWPVPAARPAVVVGEALRRPVAGPPLAEILRERVGGRPPASSAAGRSNGWRNFSAVIVVSDKTRPCPNRDVLIPILGELRLAGVPVECVTILIATGLHAPVVGAETAGLLGDDVVARHRVVNHFGRRGATLKRLGATPAGTPVVLAREWVDADVRIATGVIEPHMMAGFSGGRKAICPGIAADETVRAWHAPRFIDHERTMPGSLEGNPGHEEALAVAAFAPPHFTVNVTVDRQMRLTGVFAGEMNAAHAAGVALLREHIARPVPEACDILVTTNGGYPLDATYYQCQKGLLAGMPVMKRGGTFLFAAACEEGLGQAEFTGLLETYGTLDEFMAAITAPGAPVIKDQWALQNLAKAARHGEILFWSDRLPWDVQQKILVTPVPSLAEGLERALARHGPRARVTVLPCGPYVLPYVSDKGAT